MYHLYHMCHTHSTHLKWIYQKHEPMTSSVAAALPGGQLVRPSHAQFHLRPRCGVHGELSPVAFRSLLMVKLNLKVTKKQWDNNG